MKAEPRFSPTPEEVQRKIAYTIKEAVRASGLSRSMLYVAIRSGALPVRKCGARTLVLDPDLRRFLRGLPHLQNKAPEPPSQHVRFGKRVNAGREPEA